MAPESFEDTQADVRDEKRALSIRKGVLEDGFAEYGASLNGTFGASNRQRRVR
jgi:hypothetical protein